MTGEWNIEYRHPTSSASLTPEYRLSPFRRDIETFRCVR